MKKLWLIILALAGCTTVRDVTAPCVQSLVTYNVFSASDINAVKAAETEGYTCTITNMLASIGFTQYTCRKCP